LYTRLPFHIVAVVAGSVGLLIMPYVAGSTLAIIFQPAHLVEGSECAATDEQMSLEHNWTVHQFSMNNFGNSNRWFSW
jgi:linoleoyl-CoA desaturase